MQNGDNISIDIFGPLNNSHVRVGSIENTDNRIAATFLTTYGHVERGNITFSITQNEDESLTFEISSKSVGNYGSDFLLGLMGSSSREEQSKSWLEVLGNFTTETGNTEGNVDINFSAFKQTSTGLFSKTKKSSYTGNISNIDTDDERVPYLILISILHSIDIGGFHYEMQTVLFITIFIAILSLFFYFKELVKQR